MARAEPRLLRNRPGIATEGGEMYLEGTPAIVTRDRKEERGSASVHFQQEFGSSVTRVQLR